MDDCTRILKRKWTTYRSALSYRLNVENTGLFKFQLYRNKCICNIDVYITVHEHPRFAAPKQSVCVRTCTCVLLKGVGWERRERRKQDNINIGRCRYGWRPISISFPCRSIFVCSCLTIVKKKYDRDRTSF